MQLCAIVTGDSDPSTWLNKTSTCHADLDPDQGKGKASEVDTHEGHDPGLETGTTGMSEAEAETGECSITPKRM